MASTRLRDKEEDLVVDEDYIDQSWVLPEMRAVLVDWLLQGVLDWKKITKH